MKREEIVTLMENVPGSYDDFVNDMADWMMRDDQIKRSVLQLIKTNPKANTDDITLVLWEHLGIGEPLEIMDDEEATLYSPAALQVAV